MKRGHFYFAKNRTFLYGIDNITYPIAYYFCIYIPFLLYYRSVLNI